MSAAECQFCLGEVVWSRAAGYPTFVHVANKSPQCPAEPTTLDQRFSVDAADEQAAIAILDAADWPTSEWRA